MRNLTYLLQQVCETYEDLEDALVPSGSHPLSGEGGGGGGTKVDAPLPVDVAVVEHRHKLVRGLRWYCASVTRSGDPVETVPAMAAALLAAPVIPEADQLATDLRAWLARSYRFLGAAEPRSTPLVLPDGAGDHRVRVADAARLLACSVRTIQRRVPAEHRSDGTLELWRALPDCPRCDLKVGAGCACAVSA